MIERIRELLRGDREKPGAKEGGGADLALLCPPEPLSRWIPRWAPKQKQSSLAPGFSRSPLRSSRIRSIIRYGYAQRGTPTRIAASVTRKIGSNHDELLVGLYEQQGHLLTLDRLTWMLSKSATDPRGTR